MPSRERAEEDARQPSSINYIFLISPNNSGTTVASQFISSKIRECYLPKTGNNEGLKIKEIWETIKDTRWDPKVPINYRFAKEIWEQLAIQEKCSSFFEASPPNLCHVKEIIQEFKNLITIFWISNPYLYIGSCVNRYSKGDFHESVAQAAKKWMHKAEIQRQNHLLLPNTPKLNYEDFCRSPDSYLAKKIGHLISLKQDSGQISGKNTSKLTSIVNMTPKYIAFLGTSGLQEASKELSQNEDLLKYFRYEILSPDDTNTMIQADILLAMDGIRDRIKWDKKTKRSK